MLETQLIDDFFYKKASNKKIIIENPATQNKIFELSCTPLQDVEHSIENSSRAFLSWKNTPHKTRASHLNMWANLITQHEEDLARLMTQESGKPLKESHTEVLYAKSFITWFSNLIENPSPTYQTSTPFVDSHITWRPVGPVYAITPWNFPAAMVTRKVAPALAAGCPVILKPSEETPLSALALHKLALQAGIPKDVFQIVLENDPALVTAPMMKSQDIRKITFTGSTHVGKILFAQSADTMKRISLELGGNAPFIVFEDANIHTAVHALITSKFRNAGQTCVSPNRVFVHQKIHHNFIDILCHEISKLSIGDGMQNHDIGPLINKKAVSKVEYHVQNAIQKGAILHLGGKRHQENSLFYTPTVLSNVTDDMLAFQEETFGPVVSIASFENNQDVLQRANNTPFGLASYVISENQNNIKEAQSILETGMLAVNTGKISHAQMPFGGVKQSGIGREGGKEGIFEFLETHTTTVKNTSTRGI